MKSRQAFLYMERIVKYQTFGPYESNGQLFYLVTEWLAKKLMELGEPVVIDKFNKFIIKWITPKTNCDQHYTDITNKIISAELSKVIAEV